MKLAVCKKIRNRTVNTFRFRDLSGIGNCCWNSKIRQGEPVKDFKKAA